MPDQVRTEERGVAASDRQAQRRAARREANRAEILDAAEEVFGRDGIRDGSLRDIGAVSGFSTAAIYLFFDSKQDLVEATLTRRGLELRDAVAEAAAGDETPMVKLHRIIDVTVAFFADRPHFRDLLGHLRGGTAILGPVLGEPETGTNAIFDEVMTVLADLVRSGQQADEIREGDPRALAHLYSVLINEYVLLTSAENAVAGTLSAAQFHDLVDGALRQPAARSRRAKR